MTGAPVDPVAFHEAGHVVAGRLLGLELIDTDLLPDREGGRGHTHFADPGVTPPPREFVERLLTIFMAGFAAESRAGHADLDGSGYDRDQAARRWAGLLVGPGSDADVSAVLESALERASALLDRPGAWAAVEAVAGELGRRRRLDAREVAEILGRLPSS